MSTVGFDEELRPALDDHADAARPAGAVMVALRARRAAALTGVRGGEGEAACAKRRTAYELGTSRAGSRLLTKSSLNFLTHSTSARVAWLQQTSSGGRLTRVGCDEGVS